MGFRARSAEDMYRYAFRLDDPDRALGDGFGWTILLLGDSGEVTREFLERYGVELSIVTAHRVRFAFFSGVSERETAEYTWAARSGRYATRSFLDRLQRSLGTLTRFRRPLDWEGEHWRGLRPGALLPFRDARGVHRHLQDESPLVDSSIPGAEEAVRLAQTLGIGRHVPCLLIFTDLGAPRYHVLPFGDRSPSQVYARVKGWVDHYYEVNQPLLDRWSSVEKRIQSLAWDARVRLDAVRAWPRQRRDAWLALSLLAEGVRLVRDRPDAALQVLRNLISRPGLDPRVSGPARSLVSRLEEFDRWEEREQHLDRTVRALREAADAERMTDVLRRLRREPPDGLSPTCRKVIEEATVLWTEPGGLSPENELFRWWRTLQNPLFSRRKFSRLRPAWYEFHRAAQREGESCTHQIRRDYDAFWATLGSSPLSAPPEHTTDHVLAQLARHYGVSPTTPEWTTATQGLGRHVTEALRRAQRGAPSWLLQLSPPVPLRECLYLGGRIDQDAFREFLASSPQLTAAVAESNSDTIRAEQARARLASCLRHRDAVVQALLEDARRTQPVSRAAVAQDIARELEELRADLQARIENESDDVFRERSDVARLEENLATAARLGAVLEQYDDAMRHVVHPHVDDPWVVALPRTRDLHSTFGLDADLRHRTRPSRRSVHVIRDQTQEALSRGEEVQQDVAQWYQDIRFADVLTAVLPRPRAAAVLAPFPGTTLHEKAARVVRDRRAVELLRALSGQELGSMLERARPEGAPRPRLDAGEEVTPAAVLAVFGLHVPAPSPERRPRVLISYAHEDDGGVHAERVRDLWLLLRRQGVDARLDLSADEVPQDWALWMHQEFRAADHVLVIASPAYKRRAEGTEEPGTGAGVIWEARYIRNEVYTDPVSWHRRILKVVLPGGDRDDLPDYLGGHAVTHYTVDPIDERGAEKLLRYLTGQPYEVEPPLGPVRSLPPRRPV